MSTQTISSQSQLTYEQKLQPKVSFSLSTSQLVSAIEKVLPALNKKVAILSTILIQAIDANTITISATDLELAIQSEVNINIENPNEDELLYTHLKFCINANKLLLLLKTFQSTPIDLILTQNDYLLIKYKDSNFELPGLSADQFPQLPTIKFYESENKTVTISYSTFRNMILHTKISVSDSDSRIGGKFMSDAIYLDVINSKLISVAADGLRLSKFETSLGETIGENKFGMLLSARIFDVLLNFDDPITAKDVQIFYNKQQTIFKFHNAIIIAGTLVGDYFNYRTMGVQNPDFEIIFEVNILKEILERSLLFSEIVDDNDKKLKGNAPVDFEIKSGIVKILGESSKHGRAKETFNLPLLNSGPQNITYSFRVNSYTLLDMLKVITSEFISCQVTQNKMANNWIPWKKPSGYNGQYDFLYYLGHVQKPQAQIKDNTDKAKDDKEIKKETKKKQ